jgi:FHA domain
MMAKLLFSLDGNSLGEYGLDKERMTIGRRPASDIHIDNLAVSGDHALITTIGNDSFIEDLSSTNGTLVNDRPIKKHVLEHGDVIEFGKYQLKYINKAQEQKQINHLGFENTVVVRPAKLAVATPIMEPRVEAEEAKPSEENQESVAVVLEPSSLEPVQVAQKIGHLQMLNGANTGREMTLNKTMTTLGKPGAQVAVITKRPHGYFITHVEGEKHLLVNGQSVGLQAYELSNQDEIDLAGVKLKFYLV